MDPQLFYRVPPEIWSILLGYLEHDYNSLFNLHGAQPKGAWRDLLIEDRTRFLLPLVLPILRNYLSSKDLLLLRRICKTWNFGVTSELLNQFGIPFKSNHDLESEWLKGRTTICTTFRSVAKMKRVLEQRTNPEENPFPSRAVVCCPPAVSHCQIFYTKLDDLLQRFGHHIHTFTLLCDGSLPECNRLLQQIIGYNRIPNIKHLIIHRPSHYMDDEEPNYQEWKQSVRWMKFPQLFSPLKNLRFLNISVGDVDDDKLLNSLLTRYSSQLTQYQTDLTTFRSLEFFQEAYNRQNLKNLKHLKICGYYGDSSILDLISPFNLPNLEGLYLAYREVGRRCNNLRSILKLVNRSAQTLTELRWPCNLFTLDDTYPNEYGGNSLEEFWEDVGVKLEKIKWMGIPYSYIGYSILDLLLEKVPKLEHLHIMDFDLEYSDELVEIEELHQQTDHFWEKLSSLKKITVEKTNVIVFTSSRELCEYRKELRTYSPLGFVFSDNESD